MSRQRIRLLVIGAILAVVLIFGGYEVYLRSTHVYETDARITADIVTMSSRAEGWLVEVPVREGMRIEANQVVARIDDRTAKLRADALKAQIQSIQADRTRLLAERKMIENQADAKARTRASGVKVTQAARDMLVVVRIAIGDGGHLDQFRAAQPQKVLLLLTLRVGDHDDGAIAARIGDDREADTGVARSALDDHAARLDVAAPLRLEDDLPAGAILDRLAGIHELGLSENDAAGQFRGTIEFDEWRMADGFDHILINFHERMVLVSRLRIVACNLVHVVKGHK